MTGLGIRVLFAAHALWRGTPTLVLPSKTLPSVLGIKRTSLARGRRLLVAAGLLVPVREYVRPGGAGCSGEDVQRAAEWDIPYANQGHRAGQPVRLDNGDERLSGYWRIPSADLLQLVGVKRGPDGKTRQFLSDDQLRVLVVLAGGPRASDGSLQDPTNAALSARDLVTRLPGMTLRTAQRALASLEASGLACRVSFGAGRAPAVYQPAGALVRGLPWKHTRTPHGTGR